MAWRCLTLFGDPANGSGSVAIAPAFGLDEGREEIVSPWCMQQSLSL